MVPKFSRFTDVQLKTTAHALVGKSYHGNTVPLTFGDAVGDDIYLNGTGIDRLELFPRLLCLGNVFLRDIIINAFGSALYVGGNLTINIKDSNFPQLPNRLLVWGNVKLVGNLRELPQCLYVMGDLDITQTNIKAIPKTAKVMGRLHANFLPITFEDLMFEFIEDIHHGNK